MNTRAIVERVSNYTIWFHADGPQRFIDVVGLREARIIWDALIANGFHMVSARP